MRKKTLGLIICMLVIANVIPCVESQNNNNMVPVSQNNTFKAGSSQNWTEIQKLIASDGESNEYFGGSSFDDDTTFIGASFFIKGKTFYGYRVYPNPDLLIWFDKDNPETLNTIGPSISSDKIAGGTWVDGIWWCCEYSAGDNSNIWTIDHITGDMTLIGESGRGLNGLAYDDTTYTMYACSVTDLFTINMTTGSAIVVGSFGISGSVMSGIACDGYGNMYAEDLHTDSLYSIDLTTGVATLIGPFGLDLNYGQDMAFDKEEGICYLSAFTVHAGNEGALYTCNLSNGATTKIGTFGSEPTQITGLAIPYVLNYSPNIPIITGPMSGNVGTEYDYTTSTTDPESDNVWYWFDWDDGTNSEWVGPYDSGAEVTAEHTWTTKGDYSIKVKAKDTHDAESDWSDPLPVTMPWSYNLPLHWFWERLLQRFPNAFPLLRQLVGY